MFHKKIGEKSKRIPNTDCRLCEQNERPTSKVKIFNDQYFFQWADQETFKGENKTKNDPGIKKREAKINSYHTKYKKRRGYEPL